MKTLVSKCVMVVLATTLVVAAQQPGEPENRSFDGSGNNLDHPNWGATFEAELRSAPPAYADGISAPAGESRPSPRMISNMVVSQPESMQNEVHLSDWVWQWGQFLDHDITLTEFIVPEEPFPVAVPMGDNMFDPDATGNEEILLLRSNYDPASGTSLDNPRQQINQITAFIDASNVYGSDADRAAWLRTFEGGMLKTSVGDLLPFNDGSQVNAGPGGLPSFATDLFTAGDIRCNEQSGLTAAHTLFLREHNRLAGEIATEHPDWTDEQIYQRARKTVGALLQLITFHEFLPALLGPNAPSPTDAQYDPDVNPSIANVFANACYRIGHTMLSPQIMRLDNDHHEIAEGNLPLRDAFFNPSRVMDEGGIEPILMGLASQRMQTVDQMIVDDVRNFLFGEPGDGGFDLASLNIQRGRDHGLPDYNTVRESFGLARVTGFDEITSDANVQERLEAAYGSVDDIDVWVGALSEDHLPDSNVGELIFTVLSDQFTRLRDGDRFWYANDPAFSPVEIADLETTTLADIIRRNTDITGLQDFVLNMPEHDGAVGGEPALCGVLQMFNLLGMGLGLTALRFTRRR